MTLFSLVFGLFVTTQYMFTGVANASVSDTVHATPWAGNPGVVPSNHCAGESPGYACTVGGYAAWLAKPGGWAWSYYGGSIPSRNAFGPHNCTLYVAYRLQRIGVTLTWSANAVSWASEAASNGATVDQTPNGGSVAQWNNGHVAYVDAVTPRYIVITSDNYQPSGAAMFPGGFTDSFDIARNSPAMPDNFIHFVAPAKPLAPVLALLTIHIRNAQLHSHR